MLKFFQFYKSIIPTIRLKGKDIPELEREEDVYQGVSRGSITPRTVKETIVIQLKDEPELVREIETLCSNEEHDEKRKCYDESKINERIDHIEASLVSLDKYFNTEPVKIRCKEVLLIEKAILQQHLYPEMVINDIDSLTFIRTFQYNKDNSKAEVSHFGIQAKKSMVLKGHIISKNKLHPIEDKVLRSAITSLDNCLDAENVIMKGKNNIPNNVVLVSFFKRYDDYLRPGEFCIGIDKAHPDEVETHTIVLWKISKEKYKIIDPNNSEYSSFLSELYGKALDDKKITFEASQKTQIIYSSVRIKGKNKEKIVELKEYPRDCTDISVKIAFELNERQISSIQNNTIDSILNDVVDRIGNKNIPEEIGLLRSIQSSNSEIREKAMVLVKKLKESDLKISKNQKKSFKDIIVKEIDITEIETIDGINESLDLFSDILGENIASTIIGECRDPIN